jgi:hypothetical protein
MAAVNLHKSRKYFGFVDENDGCDGNAMLIRESLSPTRAQVAGAGMDPQFWGGSHVTHASYQSWKRQRRPHPRSRAGLVSRSGEPDRAPRPRGWAVADASGSEVRDRPQDLLSGSDRGRIREWEVPSVGQVFEMMAHANLPRRVGHRESSPTSTPCSPIRAHFRGATVDALLGR